MDVMFSLTVLSESTSSTKVGSPLGSASPSSASSSPTSSGANARAADRKSAYALSAWSRIWFAPACIASVLSDPPTDAADYLNSICSELPYVDVVTAVHPGDDN
jgi:hypothetical protein